MQLLLSKKRKTEIIYRLLYFCLRWIRDKETEELTIVLRARHAPTIIKGEGSVLWQPQQVEQRILKISDWADFETPQWIKLKKLKKLFSTQLPECELKITHSKEGFPILEILWPSDIIFEVDKDIELATKKKGISSTYSILTLLTYKPDWITSGQCQVGDLFYKKMPMGFEKLGCIIYEGAGNSYVMSLEGLRDIHVKSIEDLMNSENYLQTFRHDKGYETWRNAITQYLQNE